MGTSSHPAMDAAGTPAWTPGKEWVEEEAGGPTWGHEKAFIVSFLASQHGWSGTVCWRHHSAPDSPKKGTVYFPSQELLSGFVTLVETLVANETGDRQAYIVSISPFSRAS